MHLNSIQVCIKSIGTERVATKQLLIMTSSTRNITLESISHK